MKKFTTKKLAIAFVAIAFLFIFGFTAYRGVTGQFQSQPTISNEVKSATKKKDTSKKEETKQEETKQIESQKESKKTDTKSSASSSKQETKKQETKKTETKSSSSKQETKKQETKKTETKSSSSKQETKKQETQTSAHQHVETPKQDTPVKQTVSIKVIGINTTMMQGNIEVNSSSTAYSVLKELAKQNGKSISTKGFGSTIYVSGIDGLKEFDHGPSSGWMYKVNGTPPKIGAGAYKVKAGDTVIWYYVNAEQ